jgi:hypothetical protein
MVLCCSCFAPSPEFLPYLTTYLNEVAENKTREFYEAAQTALRRIRRVRKIGPRRLPPASPEIQSIKVCPHAMAILLLLRSVRAVGSGEDGNVRFVAVILAPLGDPYGVGLGGVGRNHRRARPCPCGSTSRATRRAC